MRIVETSQKECGELLNRVSVARLACALDNQPYVVPVCFAYEASHIYLFSTVGKKIEWMRQNPKVCLQADEVGSRSSWSSVVVNGTYVELREPQYTAQKEHAKQKLARFSHWWETPVVERREQMNDIEIEPVFFRIDIESMTGLKAIPESE